MRIVSLPPSATETVFAPGLGDSSESPAIPSIAVTWADVTRPVDSLEQLVANR